jgi:hypothetical protein
MGLAPRSNFHHSQALPAAIRKTRGDESEGDHGVETPDGGLTERFGGFSWISQDDRGSRHGIGAAEEAGLPIDGKDFQARVTERDHRKVKGLVDIRDSRISFPRQQSGHTWHLMTANLKTELLLIYVIHVYHFGGAVSRRFGRAQTLPDSTRESGMNSLSWGTMGLAPRSNFHHSQALPDAIRNTKATKANATIASKRQLPA